MAANGAELKIRRGADSDLNTVRTTSITTTTKDDNDTTTLDFGSAEEAKRRQ
jgi:hypothetical protein